MTKQYFYLTNEGLTAFEFTRGKLQNRQEFILANEGLQRFAQHLNERPSAQTPAYLFVDLYDEDFRLDTIPHLGSNDAQAVINRRLSQLFRNTPYRQSLKQGREADGRRDDRVLYHAINNADVLDPWLDVMAEAQVPLEQISSTAVASQRMLKEMGLASTHILLLTFVPHIGLRQTYFRDQELKFSRLTPLPLDQMNQGAQANQPDQSGQISPALGALVDAETNRTWQYLDSLRFFNADSVLEVCVLTSSAAKVVLETALTDTPVITHRVFDLAPIAAKLGLTGTALQRTTAEEVYLSLFAKSGVPNHFATTALRAQARHRTAKSALSAATLGLLVIGASVAVSLFWQATKVTAQTEAQIRETTKLEADFQRISGQMRNQNTPPDTVRDTATFYTSQIAPIATPNVMVGEVAEVLSQIPEISLAQIVWQVVADPNAPISFSALVTNLSSVKSVPVDAAKTAAARSTTVAGIGANTAAPLAAHKAQAAVFEATLTRFDGDYRRANAVAAALVATLNARGVVEAKLQSQPLETQANATISGQSSASDTRDYADVRFEVRVVLKPSKTGAPTSPADPSAPMVGKL